MGLRRLPQDLGEGKYREFRSLYDSGRLRYALYALHDGLEAALRHLARQSGVLGLQPDTRLTLHNIVALLRERLPRSS